MNEYIYNVQGSEPEPYVVTCKEIENELTIECNCRAGSFGKLCKHKIEIVQGQIDEGNKLFFNRFDATLQELTEIENAMKKLKSEQKKAKRILENTMKGK